MSENNNSSEKGPDMNDANATEEQVTITRVPWVFGNKTDRHR